MTDDRPGPALRRRPPRDTQALHTAQKGRDDDVASFAAEWDSDHTSLCELADHSEDLRLEIRDRGVSHEEARGAG